MQAEFEQILHKLDDMQYSHRSTNVLDYVFFLAKLHYERCYYFSVQRGLEDEVHGHEIELKPETSAFD